MTKFTEEVINIIKSIPKGKVMTYGQIAILAGNPKAARQVARLLHSMSRKYKLPWHRIVNHKGKIAFKDDESYTTQLMLLIDEGIEVNHGAVDLKKYQM